MAALDDLLVVQELDTNIDQLIRRRETLPQRELLSTAKATLAKQMKRSEELFAELRGHQAKQKAIEDEAATNAEKAAGIDAKLYDGSVTQAKELEAFQQEAAMLKDRGSELDDRTIAVMEIVEPLESELAEAREAITDSEKTITDTEASLAAEEAEIDSEGNSVAAERAEKSAELDAGLLEEYEMIRKGLGGIGAARLVGNSCEGCHLEIPSADLEKVRGAPDGEVVPCPECGRILVR